MLKKSNKSYTTFSKEGSLSASVSNEGFNDSSEISDIFTCICFYCAIFDGLSVFRKKEKSERKMLVYVIANIRDLFYAKCILVPVLSVGLCN